MQLFYSKDIDNDIITLNEEESRHVIKVLRKGIGADLSVVDGCGTLYKSEIIDAHQKHTLLRIKERVTNYGNLSYNLHVAVAPTKNIDRIEWFVEKATEIGIKTISLIKSSHSERKDTKIERLEKVAISAMKQSVKAYKPQVNETISFENFIKMDFGDADKFIAHCNDSNVKPHISNLLTKNDIIILIGPEGDFSPVEVSLALECGFKEISLGNERLRTETAALYATTAVAINFSK